MTDKPRGKHVRAGVWRQCWICASPSSLLMPPPGPSPHFSNRSTRLRGKSTCCLSRRSVAPRTRLSRRSVPPEGPSALSACKWAGHEVNRQPFRRCLDPALRGSGPGPSEHSPGISARIRPLITFCRPLSPYLNGESPRTLRVYLSVVYLKVFSIRRTSLRPVARFCAPHS